MQQVSYFDKPSPHIVIDNFLEPRQARQCLEEAIKLEPFYQPATVAGDAVLQPDHCEECKRQWNISRNVIRENDVIYMNETYKNKRQHSVILEYLHQAIQTQPFSQIITKQGFFHILNHVNTSEAILSRYGMCDFYGWHTDTVKEYLTSRVVSLVYYLNEEPERFEGGDLIITGSTIHDYKAIKPKHNKLVIFQSEGTVHGVDTVKLPKGDFAGGRFSINFWLSINNNLGFCFR